MKRITSLLLALVLLLSMIPTGFAATMSQPPEKIDGTTVWSYLDDNSDPAGDPNAAGYDRTSWTKPNYDCSAWKTGSGSFGAKRGGAYNSSTSVLLEGCPGTAENNPTYYFRTEVYVEDASAVTMIKGSISYDDAAIIYLNGIKAAAFNDEGCDANSSYSAHKANTTENFEITDPAVLNALKDGINTVAVELHNHYDSSSDILFAMNEMVFSTDELQLISSATEWQYLDNNTDPANGNSNRTVWTAESFDTNGWKSAAGPFGSKRGTANYSSTLTAAAVLNGCDGKNNTPAYFFRTTFHIESLEDYTKLTGSLQYDDGVIVYINGHRVAAGHDIACDENGNSLGKGFDANLQFGGSNQGPDTLTISLLDLSILNAGKGADGDNTIAVELHNGRKTSSDVWFSFGGLFLSKEKVDYQNNISLSVGTDESHLNFTWYSPFNDALVILSDKPDMTSSREFTANISVANDGQYSCKTEVDELKPNTTYYYQLSNAGHKSDVYSFTTASDNAFSFAFVGDPQIGAGNIIGDIAGWENTLNTVAENTALSDVSFLLSAGDQVNTASDEGQYDGYLDHKVLTALPAATVIGNHDNASNAYGQHFNIANESDQYGKTNAGGDYYFVYNNVLFLMLNSNAQSAADVAGHKAFMEQAIEATKNENIQWKVVAFHHTLFTVASHAHDGYIVNEGGFKDLIIPVLEELDVDVVLSGHDHVYCRTYMMDGATPITKSDKYEYGNGENAAPTAVNDPDGILYITANSGSGSKTYGILDEAFPFSAVHNQENAANVSKVTITDKQFTITTYRTSDMSVIDTFSIKRQGGNEDAVQINHIYGGNNKGNTPISNSFVELHNPADKEVDLSGYTLTDGNKTIELSGTIPANGYYLIVGAAEVTTDEYLTYDLPDADMTCDWAINNKSYTIKLNKGETEIDSVTAGNSAETKISKQKSLKRNADGSFSLVVWEKGSATVDEAYITAYAPKNSKGESGSVHKAGSGEPTYTPVTASDVRINGYYDKDGSLKMELVGRHNSGAMNEDGGSLEIVTYNSSNGYAYAVSGVKGKLIAVDLNGKMDSDNVVALNGTEYDVRSLVNGFAYGDMTSVAVSPDGKMLAVAIQAENYAEAGAVAIFSCENDGSLKLIATVETGVQPDMVTFADNNTILTADEGEPRNGVNGTDPKGSVSIIKIANDNTVTSKQIFFDGFDSKREELTESGVLIQKDKAPSEDFEPEYIAVNGDTAYISLQEANSIAVMNISEEKFTGIYPLGFQDYGTTKIDLQKNGVIEEKNYPDIYGIKMPDGISVTEINGKTYLLTANEGDSRSDWQGMDNEYENKTSLTGKHILDEKVVWFNVGMWDGLDNTKDYIFGSRSFSVYEVTSNGLTLIFDSGSDFEEITASVLPDYFNASNDKITADNRSGKKGPEPESITVGKIGSKTYAFIALERIGGVMVYDITDPEKSEFVNYINSREFDTAVQGDVSPEGLCFIPATDSKTGKALLLAACEVSGTLAVYECDHTHIGIKVDGQPATATEDGWKDYYTCPCGKFFEDEACSAEITDLSAWKVGAGKIPAAGIASPTIIEGQNGKWTQGSDDGLTFRSDAKFSDFVSISVDGKVIDSENYTVKEGGTVVTLKPEYLATLSVGKHTLSINSTIGSASTEFEIKAADSTNTNKPGDTSEPTDTNKPSDTNKPNDGTVTNPPTGDRSQLFGWITLAVIGVGAIIALKGYDPKRKMFR